MHFTREPIIETIITPREGNKLLIRSSKGVNTEEFSVEALEVVSFGHAFFYRSLEKKCFLVPVTDYEVIEVKDTKIVLKNIQLEKSIKIGGGKEAAAKKHSEHETKTDASDETKQPEPVEQENRSDRKRDRRRNRRKRGGEDKNHRQSQELPSVETSQDLPKSSGEVSEGGGTKDEATEAVVSSSMFSALIPPPATLISETLNRYREKDFVEAKGDLPPRQMNSRRKKPVEAVVEENITAMEESGKVEEKKSSAWDLPILPPPDDDLMF